VAGWVGGVLSSDCLSSEDGSSSMKGTASSVDSEDDDEEV
jgi:hypothetical protein